MNELSESTSKPAAERAKKRATFFPPDLAPRALFFFITIPIQLIASLLSGIGYSADGAGFWIAGMVVWVVWFLMMFLTVTPAADNLLRRRISGWKRATGIIFVVVLVVGITELLILLFFAPGYVASGARDGMAKSLEQMQHGFQYADGTALSQQAAENLMEGKNPYAEANIITAFIKFNGSYDRVTPLKTGRLKDTFPYPTQAQLKIIWDSAIKDPSVPPPEIESRACYPSGSFLLLVPFIWAGITDIRWIYFIFVLAGLVYTVWQIPKQRRLLFIGLVLISLELWNSLAIGETGSMVFPFLLIAWITLGKNNLLSAIMIGIAVATKQTAWFFLPFYLILLWRVNGAKTSAAAVGIIAAIFAAANAWFIIQDPGLWLQSITEPMGEPMFPIGVGVIAIICSGLVNMQSSIPFLVMELIVFCGAILWYARYCKRFPDAGIILAVLPFFFAWRSLWTYFYYVTIIIIARILVREDEPEMPTALPLPKNR